MAEYVWFKNLKETNILYLLKWTFFWFQPTVIHTIYNYIYLSAPGLLKDEVFKPRNNKIYQRDRWNYLK